MFIREFFSTRQGCRVVVLLIYPNGNLIDIGHQTEISTLHLFSWEIGMLCVVGIIYIQSKQCATRMHKVGNQSSGSY